MLSFSRMQIDFKFDNFLDVVDYFKKMINLCKQMNYSEYKSDQYNQYVSEIKAMIEPHKAA